MLGAMARISFALIAAVAVLATPAAAQAQHANGGASATWQFPYYTQALDHTVTVRNVATDTEIGMRVWHQQAEASSYVTIEDQGDAGRLATFTMYGVASAVPDPGVACLRLGADGMTCIGSFPFVEGRAYQLAMSPLGGSWSATVREVGNPGNLMRLGRMTTSVPAGALGASRTYVTYFGPSVRCDAVPAASATFGPPVMNASPSERGRFYSSSVGSCSGGRVTRAGESATVEIGYRQPPPSPPAPPPPPSPAADTAKPVMGGLKLTPKRVNRSRGSLVSFTLSESATVTIAVDRLTRGRRVRGRCVKPTRRNRARRACVRPRRLRGVIRHPGHAGPNAFRFNGRLGGRRLRPGRYRLVVIGLADAAGNTGSPARADFRIRG
jgi:hypothetical protein